VRVLAKQDLAWREIWFSERRAFARADAGLATVMRAVRELDCDAHLVRDALAPNEVVDLARGPCHLALCQRTLGSTRRAEQSR
jgi:hypothetical protein